MLWVPLLYGDLDEEIVACRGFELVESDTELWEEAETPPGDNSDKKLNRHESEAGDLTRESWEVIIVFFIPYFLDLLNKYKCDNLVFNI